jgi:hypothetical protein
MESTNRSNVSEDEDTHQDEYQRLKSKHSHLEEKICELEELKFPSESEESQIRQLKKQKLSIKEQMERIQL